MFHPILKRCIVGLPVLLAPAVPIVAADELPTLDCIIEPSEVVDVGSAVAGVLETVAFDRGDSVAKDDVVARLESGMEEAAVQLARVRARLTTGVELRRTSAEFFARNEKRSQTLTQQDAISQQQLDQLSTEAQVAELQVRQEKDNLEIARLEHRRAVQALNRRAIRSPIDGVVMDRFKSVGEYVEDTPVLRIAQLDPLFVETIAPVELMGRIRNGMRAEVIPAVPGQSSGWATVSRIDRVADAASGTFGVRLVMDNPDGDVASGVRCALRFEGAAPGVTIAESQSGTVDRFVAAPSPAMMQLADAAPTVADDPVATPRQDAATASTPTEKSAKSRQPITRVPHAIKIRRTVVASATPLDVDRTPADNASTPTAPVAAAAPRNDNTDSSDDRRAATAQAVTSRAPDGALGCFEAGPFDTPGIADRIAAALASDNIDARVRPASTLSPSGYLVVTDRTANLAAGKALVRRLAEAGIADTQMLRSGAWQGRVSVGLYSKLSSAQKRRGWIEAQGFSASIVPREPERGGAWIDVTTMADVDTGTLRQALGEDAPGVVASVRCSVLHARVDD